MWNEISNLFYTFVVLHCPLLGREIMYCLNSGHGCIIFCLCISICNFAFLSSEGNCCDDNYVQSRWTLGDFVDPTDEEINIELRNIS